MSTPRLQIQDKLRADGGAILGFVAGVDDGPFALDSVESYEGQEALTFSVPVDAAGASLIREARVATVWRSDSDFDEFHIGKIVRTRAAGGTIEVTAKPPIYRLAECGLVPEWQTTNTTGKPLLDVGVASLTAHDILTTYLINNTKINSQIGWLSVGTIDSSTLISVNWSFASPLAVFLAVRDALQQADSVPYDARLVRNGTTSYDLTITAVS